MSKTPVHPLRAQLDALAKPAPKSGIVCWSARDLREPLGYAKWESFLLVIGRAIGARTAAGLGTRFYFRELTTTNAEGLIIVNDYRLTRAGCLAVVMAGDVRKKAIAFARTYFAEPPAAPAPAKKPARAQPGAKPSTRAKAAAKPAAAPKVAPREKTKKAAPSAPAAQAASKPGLARKPAFRSGSRYIPQDGDKFYGSTHASRNSRWNPNCAVSRGYHNAAAANGR